MKDERSKNNWQEKKKKSSERHLKVFSSFFARYLIHFIWLRSPLHSCHPIPNSIFSSHIFPKWQFLLSRHFYRLSYPPSFIDPFQTHFTCLSFFSFKQLTVSFSFVLELFCSWVTLFEIGWRWQMPILSYYPRIFGKLFTFDHFYLVHQHYHYHFHSWTVYSLYYC